MDTSLCWNSSSSDPLVTAGKTQPFSLYCSRASTWWGWWKSQHRCLEFSKSSIQKPLTLFSMLIATTAHLILWKFAHARRNPGATEWWHQWSLLCPVSQIAQKIFMLMSEDWWNGKCFPLSSGLWWTHFLSLFGILGHLDCAVACIGMAALAKDCHLGLSHLRNVG